MKRITGLLAAALLVAGCSTMAPDYQRPEAPVPDSWPEGPPDPAAGLATKGEQPVAEVGWRDLYGDDPVLTGLIEQSLEENRDLRVAARRVEMVRAQYRIQAAALFPQVNATASYTQEQTPAAVYGGGFGGGGAITSEYYNARVGISSYELDLFGRIRSLEDQALQEFRSTFAARRSAQISLIAEVANAYMALLGDRAQLRATEEMLDTQRQSLDLAERRFENGASSRQAVHQARTALAGTRAERAVLRRQVAQDRNALRLLAGGSLPEALTRQPDLQAVKLALPVPADLSSDLLLRRPDVLQAEHQLRAANANIGAARAAFFPTVSLTGSYGSLSSDLDGVFSADSEAWSFVPQISLPIFDGGRREANLDVAKVRKKMEVARYERTIQQAFREVADALAAYGTMEDRLSAQRERVAAARDNYELARTRFRRGIDSYLPVLDAQRTLFDARKDLIAVRQARFTNQVNLYRALGGGWQGRTEAARDSGE
ncbi:efflux transporter outer membrane subunit [Thiohalorhabdus methylotrophus]|uniref:Efflux transporter outer membrane subunit n=1 Tax=Thiohalorhabdus methylotrophus TaxID=3242694 RepID=A0ABV4TWE3_9GAMM